MAASLSVGSGRRVLAAVSKQLPVVSCAHYHAKVKVKRQKPMERRVYEEITKPLYPENFKPKPLRHSCLDPNSPVGKDLVEEENEYETFLISQLRKEVEASKMIIICHSLPFIPPRLQLLRMHLRMEGIKIGILSNKHFRLIIEGTKLANLKPLLVWQNIRITCPEEKVKTVVTLLKKFPEFQMLGGFVEDRLVSRQDLIRISQMPELEQQRGELVAILNQMGGASTLSLLNHHQQRLVSNLQQLQKQSDSS